MERPHHQGLIAQLTIPNGSSGERALIRAQRFHGPVWMEFEPGSELKDARDYAVDFQRVQAVLDRMLNAKLSLISSGDSGFHPTTYRVRIFKGTSSCEFSWCEEVPPEWLPLAEIVREIQSISDEVLGKA
jgi:hypothetical protein